MRPWSKSKPVPRVGHPDPAFQGWSAAYLNGLSHLIRDPPFVGLEWVGSLDGPSDGGAGLEHGRQTGPGGDPMKVFFFWEPGSP